MTLHRFIHRADFPISVDIINKPGQIIKKLSEMEGFEIYENRNAREIKIESFGVEYEKADYFATLSVTPTSIIFELRSNEKIPYQNYEMHSIFDKLSKTSDELRKIYNINEIIRCGIRFFCFEEVNPSSFDRFRKVYDNNFMQTLEEGLGDAKDYSVIIDGKSSDKIGYKISVGPLEKDEYIKYFKLDFQNDNLKNSNLLLDIDLFERNFDMSNYSNSLNRWSKPLFKKVESYVSKLTNDLNK